MTDTYVYLLDGKIYINLTNRCTNDCVFCIRSLKDDVAGANLRLSNENVKIEDVISQLNKFDNINGNEIIFCGYGEPLIKLNLVLELSEYIKKNYSNVKIRVNTNGMANLVHKENVISKLAKNIDAISVSLNADNEKLYDEISQPEEKYKNSYEKVKEFIKGCSDAGLETTATIVTGYKNFKPDVEKCEQIAKSLGAKFRIREWLDNGY